MTNPELISLVVSTYNRPDALSCVLASSLRQTDTHFEILVADDGSREETTQLIKNIAARSPILIRHIWHEDFGFRLAAIRNRAIEAASGNYFVFLDGDCVIQKDFIARHRALAQIGAFVTGSRILFSKMFTESVIQEKPDLSKKPYLFWISQRLKGGINKLLPIFFKLPANLTSRIDHKFKWKGIKGCNMAAWREDIFKVHGFDESFNGWGHEDADFAVRLFNAGVIRKHGYWATEVFHLWHPEEPRERENLNYKVVKERIKTNQIHAHQGLSEVKANP